MKIKNLALLLFVTMAWCSCQSPKPLTTSTPNMRTTRIQAVGPAAIVYKTMQDYSNFVPIMMNAGRTQILSFPSPTDLNAAVKPTKLKNGYLLDNRGIGANVVFTSYTYEEYSKLESVPPLYVLREKIIDLYPILEMYNCGLRSDFKNEIEELNVIIDNDFETCEQLIKINTPTFQTKD